MCLKILSSQITKMSKISLFSTARISLHFKENKNEIEALIQKELILLEESKASPDKNSYQNCHNDDFNDLSKNSINAPEKRDLMTVCKNQISSKRLKIKRSPPKLMSSKTPRRRTISKTRRSRDKSAVKSAKHRDDLTRPDDSAMLK